MHNHKDVQRFVTQGHVHPMPDECPVSLYDVITLVRYHKYLYDVSLQRSAIYSHTQCVIYTDIIETLRKYIISGNCRINCPDL